MYLLFKRTEIQRAIQEELSASLSAEEIAADSPWINFKTSSAKINAIRTKLGWTETHAWWNLLGRFDSCLKKRAITHLLNDALNTEWNRRCESGQKQFLELLDQKIQEVFQGTLYECQLIASIQQEQRKREGANLRIFMLAYVKQEVQTAWLKALQTPESLKYRAQPLQLQRTALLQRVYPQLKEHTPIGIQHQIDAVKNNLDLQQALFREQLEKPSPMTEGYSNAKKISWGMTQEQRQRIDENRFNLTPQIYLDWINRGPMADHLSVVNSQQQLISGLSANKNKKEVPLTYYTRSEPPMQFQWLFPPEPNTQETEFFARIITPIQQQVRCQEGHFRDNLYDFLQQGCLAFAGYAVLPSLLALIEPTPETPSLVLSFQKRYVKIEIEISSDESIKFTYTVQASILPFEGETPPEEPVFIACRYENTLSFDSSQKEWTGSVPTLLDFQIGGNDISVV